MCIYRYLTRVNLRERGRWGRINVISRICIYIYFFEPPCNSFGDDRRQRLIDLSTLGRAKVSASCVSAALGFTLTRSASAVWSEETDPQDVAFLDFKSAKLLRWFSCERISVLLGIATNRLEQPNPRQGPVTLDRSQGNRQNGSNLLYG